MHDHRTRGQSNSGLTPVSRLAWWRSTPSRCEWFEILAFTMIASLSLSNHFYVPGIRLYLATPEISRDCERAGLLHRGIWFALVVEESECIHKSTQHDWSMRTLFEGPIHTDCHPQSFPRLTESPHTLKTFLPLRSQKALKYLLQRFDFEQIFPSENSAH